MKCVPLLLLVCVCVRRRTAAAQSTEDGELGICGKSCERDEECTDDMKCCPNTCGEKSCTKIDIPTTEPPIRYGNESAETLNSSAYNRSD
ncbi:waprin-Phi2-like [Dendropsophus ebraccatus]|uniref:waprin-Phi2-like n=1 Tax=Dendropsophus ebraccatus TaxID=150705 RepID=UPI0038321739